MSLLRGLKPTRRSAWRDMYTQSAEQCAWASCIRRGYGDRPVLLKLRWQERGAWSHSRSQRFFRRCETLSVIKKVQSVIYIALPFEILHVWVGKKSGNWPLHVRQLLFVRIWGTLYWTWTKESKIQEASNLRICWCHVGWGWLGAEAGVVFSLCSFVCTEASIGKTLHRKTS